MFIPAINIIAKTREKIKEIVRHEFISSFLSSLLGINLTSATSKPSNESIESKNIAEIMAEARPTFSVE